MKAIVLRQHGTIDSLEYVEDFPDPALTLGHVIIRVRATSFNYHDIFTVRGMPGIKIPLPVIMGLDVAGEIVDVGKGVESWSKGDRVLIDPQGPGVSTWLARDMREGDVYLLNPSV